MATNKNERISRRSFLKTAGVGATSVATPLLVSGAAMASASRHREKGAIDLKVNGVVRTLFVEPRTSLAEALRQNSLLSGPDCTVMLDGSPVCSCSIPVAAIGKREIATR